MQPMLSPPPTSQLQLGHRADAPPAVGGAEGVVPLMSLEAIQAGDHILNLAVAICPRWLPKLGIWERIWNRVSWVQIQYLPFTHGQTWVFFPLPMSFLSSAHDLMFLHTGTHYKRAQGVGGTTVIANWLSQTWNFIAPLQRRRDIKQQGELWELGIDFWLLPFSSFYRWKKSLLF